MAFASCTTDEPKFTLSLDKATASIGVGASTTITATITPEVAGATVTFTSSNTAVATVVGTMQSCAVTGVSEGTAIITATYEGVSKTCAVSVNNTEVHASLLGTDYYVIQLDAQSRELLGNKIVADYAPDDAAKFLYIWEATYEAGTPSGQNCYGTTESWPMLIVTSVGWSGAGFNVSDAAASELDAMADVYNNAADFKLHIAIKGTQSVSHLFGFDGTAGTARVVLGPQSFVDGGVTYTAYADYTKDGEWNHFDIPVSYLVNQGWTFTTGNTTGKNIMFLLSGGTTGTAAQFDAVFFYKPLAQ
ncbi:MAG: hypothetical protein EOL95_01165 [Bacteroidia bacterium]|nr:hypothetical protein [Bacteroidia bacterium]